MRPTHRFEWRLLVCGLALLAVTEFVRFCPAAEQYVESCDGPQPTWTPEFRAGDLRLLSQRRNRAIRAVGSGSENLEFQSAYHDVPLRLEHPLPPSLVLKDELHLSLWVRSNRAGAVLALRVIFPHERDPESGARLSALIAGDTYTSVNTWQQLHCRTSEKALLDRIRLLRASLRRPIDDRDLYVDRAVLVSRLQAGTTEFFLDELQLAPLVRPPAESPIVQTSETSEEAATPVKFRLDRLLVEGRPFFPRIIPYHGDDPRELAETGLNVAWVRDYRDADLAARLRAEGLWLTAIPPRAMTDSGTVLRADDASLMPFAPDTAPILFWNLGTWIGAEAQQDLISWSKQVRTADRHFRRPILADIAESERLLSHHLDMVGLSRHILQTSFSFRDYRDWLSQRIKLARPGAFTWTWLQTEPAATLRQARGESASPIIIEPEQLRLQLYAALSTGCRGIGYWTTTPLASDHPGARERQLAMKQLHLELSLLEPMLATGKVVAHVPFTVETTEPGDPLRSGPTASAWAERSAVADADRQRIRQAQQTERELVATVIQSDQGWLLLPIWLEENAQFVPGSLTAENATIVVEGVPESASAWEISTTEIRNLRCTRVTGGLQIVVPRFDQTAAILLTTDISQINGFLKRKAAIENESARVCLELAQLKFERVKQIDHELQSLGVRRADSPFLLGDAAMRLKQADEALTRKNPSAARRLSAEAMQRLRMLQRGHWTDAVRELSSPLSSPHTLCFQTLPDHWRMVARLGRSRSKVEPNRLPSGDFEDANAVIAGGWRHEQQSIPGVAADCWLDPTAHGGSYSLRLVAASAAGEQPPTVITHSPVLAVTPPVPVQAGQIVHISGWIRVARPIGASLDGVVVYDSLFGRAGALRWREAQDWQRFEFLREVHETSELTVTLSLTGLGDVQFDDLRIIPHDPIPELATATD